VTPTQATLSRHSTLELVWRAADWRHGLRLAIAVVVSFVVSTAFGLPESFWAVMSALIVVRPTAGSTLGAGWDRVRGTLSGTVIGLGGVWLHQVGIGSHTSTLAIIAIVAFLSAVVPAMRSAPISALIILDSGGIAGHSALDVAGLRAIEIAIGVATGVAISLVAFATHARERFADASAAWLRKAARQAAADLTGASDEVDRDARREQTRKELREIAELAVGADREARWLKSIGRHPATIDRVACARVMVRLASDIGAVVRVAGCAPTPLDEATRRSLADAVATACETTAAAMTDPTTEARHGLSSLRRWSAVAESPVAWIAPPSLLLLQDLRHLQKLATPVVDTRANAS
jgi:uncharacterized membrane protein YccC